MARRETTIKHLIGVEFMQGGIRCFVAEADRELGITAKNFYTGSEGGCLNRAHLMKIMKAPDKLRQYHEAFTGIVKQIEAGEIKNGPVFCKRRNSELEWAPIGECSGATMECAFE